MRLVDTDKLPHQTVCTPCREKVSYVCLSDILNAPTIDPVHAAGGCYCRECIYKNTTDCPAYDAPFMRTSLRIKFCSEGQRKEADHD